jgi:hypothetical protein
MSPTRLPSHSLVNFPPPGGTRTSFKFKSSFNSDLVLHNANVWGDVPGGWGYMPALYLAYGALYLPLYGETPVKLIGHLQCVRITEAFDGPAKLDVSILSVMNASMSLLCNALRVSARGCCQSGWPLGTAAARRRLVPASDTSLC